jgi:MoaD family protein
MPTVKVLIPTPLRKLTNEQETVEADADNVATLMQALDAQHPGIGGRLLDEQGNLRRFVNLYVNGEDVRFLQGKETSLKAGDEVSIVPAIAGGAA